jgi:leucyl/phenylalanyl-tRNA--protein transferase
VLFPERLRISRSLRKTIRKGVYHVTADTAFVDVLEGCAGPRRSGSGTWITEGVKRAYCRLHELGLAHSVESWAGDRLVGGLYGVAVGRVFCGESMFSLAPDASKVALVRLVHQLQHWGYHLIDCQVYSDHLGRLGAETMPRAQFTRLLEQWSRIPGQPAPWRLQDASLARTD